MLTNTLKPHKTIYTDQVLVISGFSGTKEVTVQKSLGRKHRFDCKWLYNKTIQDNSLRNNKISVCNNSIYKFCKEPLRARCASVSVCVGRVGVRDYLDLLPTERSCNT